MLVVAITGRSGSGKSSVARYYKSLGHPVADGDKISRETTLPNSPCLAELADEFGSEIINADGTLNRKALSAIAFASPQKTKRLTAITHPYIIAEFTRQIDAARRGGSPLFFVDGAVIVGGPFEEFCDKIIVVQAPLDVSVSRIVKRDGISEAAAKERLAAQVSPEVLQQAADYLLNNDTTLEELTEHANDIIKQLFQAATGEEV